MQLYGYVQYSPDAMSHLRVRVRDLAREPTRKYSRSRAPDDSRASTRNDP